MVRTWQQYNRSKRHISASKLAWADSINWFLYYGNLHTINLAGTLSDELIHSYVYAVTDVEFVVHDNRSFHISVVLMMTMTS